MASIVRWDHHDALTAVDAIVEHHYTAATTTSGIIVDLTAHPGKVALLTTIGGYSTNPNTTSGATFTVYESATGVDPYVASTIGGSLPKMVNDGTQIVNVLPKLRYLRVFVTTDTTATVMDLGAIFLFGE